VTKVREIMSSPPVSVRTDDDLASTARAMRDADIGVVLVMDGDRLAGLVTDRDLVVRGLATGGDGTWKTGEICSHVTAAVSPDDDLEAAVGLMRESAVRRLPVMEQGRPVGIISLGDLAIERDRKSGLADISAAPPNR
jgi:CBS domain-containing protein